VIPTRGQSCVLTVSDVYREPVVACDRKIEAHRQTIDHKLDPALPALPPPRRSGMQPYANPFPIRRFAPRSLRSPG